MERHVLLKFGISVLALLCTAMAGSVSASTLVPQTAVPGACIPQFTLPLPVFGPAGPIKRVDAEGNPAITVTMKEIDQAVLPQGTFACPGVGAGTVTFGKTRVWAYETSDSFNKKVLGPANWPAVTVEVHRNKPTLVTYVNALPGFGAANAATGAGSTGLVQGLISIDKTFDWADPNNPTMMTPNPCMDDPLAAPGCNQPYVGPPPAVAHLHGAEISSLYDGGPQAWMTPDGKTGPGYFSLFNAGPGKAVYRYLNKQEPGTLWFHDHAMGATRTNVYSGMAAFYLLRNTKDEPLNLPKGAYEIEMAVQDRQFDTTGQLYFPDGSDPLCGTGAAGDPCLNGAPGNPTMHPFWIPEFIGDVAIVNGAPWPYFNVEPRRYRFRIVDGSNARFYNLNFGAAKVYAIGSDGNYLNAPKPLSTVLMAPGERYDLIVDFTGLGGQAITVTNDAPTPYPGGISPVPYTDLTNPLCPAGACPADQPTMANIMQFRVSTKVVTDRSCDPAVAGQCVRPKAMVALTDGNGSLAAGVKIDKKRQLVLKEIMGMGGPITVTLNNTGSNDPATELPQQGSTELWEIINLTADAHPIHTHLTQFQIVNRESFDTVAYPALWEASFPTGVFTPGYGPPLDYNTPNADGALGGNPAIGPYLLAPSTVTPPGPAEAGWKDTGRIMPGEVLRLALRFTPSTAPVVANATYAGKNLYPFDPTTGNGYVWHCHIVDHEDNDMMRPLKIVK